MIPPPFEYTAPQTVPEAIGLLGQTEGAKILAGGQSLIPMMRFRLAAPPLLIDINHIPGLESIREEDGWLKLGALTREAELDRSDLIHRRYPLLADTCRLIADPLVRNMATVGGNLAHADPANDHPATMLAYRARLVAQGPAGERIIDIDDFFLGPFEAALMPGEILTEIRIPAPQPYSSGAYQKLERKVGDYATAAVAVQIGMDPSGNCSYAGVALTNLGLTPIRAAQAEQVLLGRPLDDSVIREAAELASQAADPQEDHRGSVDYKRSLVRTLTVRGLRLATERLKGGRA
jgi:aerobic carbon-monoxide dehydrogenase medium subunit